jgi:hypothetical protein
MITIDFFGNKKEKSEKLFMEFLDEYMTTFLERSALNDIKVEYTKTKDYEIEIHLR